jgi:predicted permease
VLSRLIYVLFTPCLTFSKLAPALTPAHLVTWLPLPLNMVLR